MDFPFLVNEVFVFKGVVCLSGMEKGKNVDGAVNFIR
jgi:hypothetical protein